MRRASSAFGRLFEATAGVLLLPGCGGTPAVAVSPATQPIIRPADGETAALKARVAALDTQLAVFQLRELGVDASYDAVTYPNLPPRVGVGVDRAFPLPHPAGQFAGPYLWQVPPFIRRMTAGRVHLDLAASQVKDDFLKELAGLSSVVYVDLHGTGITDEGVDAVATMPNVEVLDLGNTPITDRGVRSLAALRKLRTLSLSAGGEPVVPTVTDAALDALGGLPELEDLNLSGTRVGNDGLRRLAGLASLRRLALGGTRVTDDGLQQLTRLAHLESLYLGGASPISPACVDVLARIPTLREVNLVNTLVGDASVARLKAARPGIKVEWTHTASH